MFSDAPGLEMMSVLEDWGKRWGGALGSVIPLVICIRGVYETTQQTEIGMKRAVVEVMRRHVDELYAEKAFRRLLREVGDFAVDLVEVIMTGGKNYWMMTRSMGGSDVWGAWVVEDTMS